MAEAEEPQLDWTKGPETKTGLVFGFRRAAFRGLMELKRTIDRQPVKPKEPSRARSGSKPLGSDERNKSAQIILSLEVGKQLKYLFFWICIRLQSMYFRVIIFFIIFDNQLKEDLHDNLWFSFEF